MAVNKGLGRGLGALLGINELDGDGASNVDTVSSSPKLLNTKVNKVVEEVEKISADEGVILLDIHDIDPNYEQPRKYFDENALHELADSIRIHGVIQPIVVTRIGLRFMIIAGERRWRASQLAGRKTIPAVIRNYNTQQIKEISLIENLQREDLNPVEAARAIRQLMNDFNMTQEIAADRIGKSRSSIANTLRLLTLDPQVITMVEQGRLSAGHAKTLVAIGSHKDQLNLALKASDNKMSVRDIEKLVREFNNPKPELEKKETHSLELQDLISSMQRVFATKVKALGNDTKGRIYIDYYSKDDLDRICQLVEDWKLKKN